MGKKVDVIIPVYNAENYLKRCINCLERQLYKNLNVIFVDDGSTDNSGEICDRYVDKYKNFSVIHQKNKGLSGARNTGLLIANGDYITFLDPDDWIDPDYILKCMREAEKYNFPDLVFTPYCREYRSKSIKNNLFEGNKNIYLNHRSFLDRFYITLFGRNPNTLRNPAIIDDFSPVWSKFYKKSLVNDVAFVDTKKIGTEDLWFNVNALYKANDAIYVSEIYYHYNKQNNNSLTKNYKEYLEPGWKKLFGLMKKFIADNKLDGSYYERLDVRQGFAIVTLLREIISADTLSIKQKLNKMKNLLNDDFYIACLKRYDYDSLSIKWKVLTYLCLSKKIYTIFILITFSEPLKKYLK